MTKSDDDPGASKAEGNAGATAAETPSGADPAETGAPAASDPEAATAAKAGADADPAKTGKPAKRERPSESTDAPESAAPSDPMHAPLTFPDDGPLAAKIRRLDNAIGRIEQVGLVALLAIVVLVAAGHAILDKVAGIHIEIKGELVKQGTFAIAIFGAVFATHQSRHLSMDLISRRLSPRNRLVLKVILALFAAFICVLLLTAGLSVIEDEKSMKQHNQLLTSVQVAWMIPIGAALIIFHLFLHTIIDIDYLARGKTPPERMRSGH